MTTRFRLTSLIPLEKDVQASVLVRLRCHAAVAWVERFNSGRAWLKGRGGHDRPVQFNTCEGCTDILGQLRDGRLLAVEIKRPGWRKPKDEREKKQAEFIEKVNRHGGVAFFATSIDDVEARLGRVA